MDRNEQDELVPPAPQFVQRIVSGGQTGVDQGALQAAIDSGVDHGGWCPRGRMCEAGVIPRRFQLTESTSREYWVRTEQNVIDSDGTLVLYYPPLAGGTGLTIRMAEKHRRPYLAIDLSERPDVEAIRRWIIEQEVHILNVAGPRESSHPGIGRQTYEMIRAVLGSAA